MNAYEQRKRDWWNHCVAKWAVEGDADAINVTQMKLRGLLGVVFKPEYDYVWKEILSSVPQKYSPEQLELSSRATYLMAKGRFWMMMHGLAIQAGISRPRLSNSRTADDK